MWKRHRFIHLQAASPVLLLREQKVKVLLEKTLEASMAVGMRTPAQQMAGRRAGWTLHAVAGHCTVWTSVLLQRPSCPAPGLSRITPPPPHPT